MATKPAPQISVMMPCFNNAAYIEQAIASVLDQSIDLPLELVVFDDGSTDQSHHLVENFNDSRVRLVHGGRNRGIAAVRNALLECVSGTYLTSLDGDDLYYHHDKLAHEWNLLLSSDSPLTTIAYSDIQIIDSKGDRIICASQMAPPDEGRLFQAILDRRVMIPRDFLCHRSLYEAAGGFDESLPIYEDWDHKLRLARYGEFRFTGHIGVGYRKHGLGLSAAKLGEHQRVQKLIRQKYGTEGFDGDPTGTLRFAQRVQQRFYQARAVSANTRKVS